MTSIFDCYDPWVEGEPYWPVLTQLGFNPGSKPPSIKAIAEAVRERLEPLMGCNIMPGEPVFDLLLHMLSVHPRREEKVAGGLWMFRIRPNRIGRKTYVEVVVKQRNGDQDPMSWSTGGLSRVLSGRSMEDMRANFYEAMRFAVLDQIQAFKQAKCGLFGTWTCEMTDKTLASADVHVDHHVVGFHRLVNDWLLEEDLDLSDVAIKSRDGVGGYELADLDQRSSWQEYHRQRARLRILDKVENMRIGSPR